MRHRRWHKLFTHSLIENFYKKTLQCEIKYRCTIDAVQSGSTIQYSDCTFYLKKQENYLEKYLNIKKRNLKPNEILKPTIPLLFYLIERYYRAQNDQGHFTSIALDKKFSEIMKSLPSEINSKEKIGNLLKLYKKSTQIGLFGPEFSKFPEDNKAEAWVNNSMERLFSESWLSELREAGGNSKKNLHLDFKYPKLTAKGVLTNEEISIPIKKELIGSGRLQFNPEKVYSLEIIPNSGSSVLINLEFKEEGEDNFFLIFKTTKLKNCNSALYESRIWEEYLSEAESRRKFSEGHVEIKGGIPMILSVTPNATPEHSNHDIKIKVQNGGIAQKITLKNGNQEFKIPLLRNLEQTLTYQEFIFNLDECTVTIPRGSYELAYFNKENDKSLNSLGFDIKGYMYKVWIKKLKCIDESDPEWAGDDSISFQTFINTNKFIQLPTLSKVYDDFEAGTSISSFRNNDQHIYFKPTERRIIEGKLHINIAIYEHDDLAWLEFLISAVISLVQSFLAHLIDVFTLGLGGYIIEAGLEVSGLNDMREEAVDSMVSGMEVEVLHQGKVSITPNEDNNYTESLVMGRRDIDESVYKVTFGANRIVQE